MERCVTDQLMEHIHSDNLMEPLQSAYRPCHSMETALLKVKTDILMVMDNQEITCLVLLDLSAAFNIEDHYILLNQWRTTLESGELLFSGLNHNSQTRHKEW